MKPAEIIEMAREADKLSASKVDWDFEWVEIFAKLVAAKYEQKIQDRDDMITDLQERQE